jgi:SAM-dependent methyltransferase
MGSDETMQGGDARIWHPWVERNKAPILEVLDRALPSAGTALEIASGSGQHAVYLAERLSRLRWLPSDIDPAYLASIRAWAAEARLPNLLDPIELDVRSPSWGVGRVEAIFNANMIHIAPWECCLGLLAGARRSLVPGGALVLYGPFRIGGSHTAPSNAEFDRDLRSRDRRFGVRDIERVCDAAQGLELIERVEMPANNQILVLSREDS